MTATRSVVEIAVRTLPLQNGSPNLLVVLGITLVILVAGALVTVRTMAVYGNLGGEGERSPESLTNCPECGARTSSDESTCEYCGEAIRESVEADAW